MARYLVKCLRLNRNRETLLLLAVACILTIIQPPWRIFMQLRNNSSPAEGEHDKYLLLLPTMKPAKYDYHLSVFEHKVYKNEEMIKAMLGDKNGMEFIKKYLTDGQCRFRNCPHKKLMEFLIPNTKACTGHQKKFFLLMVYTATGNFKQRSMVRKTWGTPNLFSQLESTTIFIIGTTRYKSIQAEIEKESHQYNDIVQADFHDSYGNLSLKGRSYIQWISKHCSNASYIIKSDDDQYLDIFHIVRILQDYPLHSQFMLGHIKKGVIRRESPGKKTNVKDEIFPGLERYPTFFHGSAYVLAGQSALKMTNISMQTPIFHLDDVYMSGVLAGQVRKMTYYRYRALWNSSRFQPTYPNLSKRVADLEERRTTWCKHIALNSQEFPALFDNTSLHESQVRAKCIEPDFDVD